MAVMSVADIAAIELENVQEMIPELFKDETTLDGMIQDNGRAQRVGSTAYRIPMKYARPGNYKKGDLDGGALPIGAGSKWNKGTCSPQVLMLPVGFSKLAEMIGQKVDKVGVANVVQESLTDAADQMKQIRDIMLQTDGTGKIGVVAAVDTTNNVVTLDGGFGARLILPGQNLTVWNGDAQRTGGASTYAAVDQVFNTLGGTQSFHYAGTDITSAGDGDIIRPEGLTDGAPVFIHGLRAFINNSTAGTVLAITKAGAPYVVSNAYDLGGAQISLPAARLLINQVQSRLGKKALKGQFWHTHPSQVAAYEELGFERQEIESNGTYGKMDLMFEDFAIAGFPIYTNNNADQTIWDFIQPKAWGKVQYAEGPFWYDTGNGSKLYPLYDPSTGAPVTSFGATLVSAHDYYVDNFLCQGSITTCRVPAGN